MGKPTAAHRAAIDALLFEMEKHGEFGMLAGLLVKAACVIVDGDDSPYEAGAIAARLILDQAGEPGRAFLRGSFNA